MFYGPKYRFELVEVRESTVTIVYILLLGSHLSSLQRERNLQNELRDLRLNYDELLNNYELMCQQNHLQQSEFSKKNEELSLDRENQLKNLKEELFVLKNKLELSEKDRKAAMDLKTRNYQV